MRFEGTKTFLDFLLIFFLKFDALQKAAWQTSKRFDNERIKKFCLLSIKKAIKSVDEKLAALIRISIDQP